MKLEEPISGAILMVGSLYWDDHARRKSLRNNFLSMSDAKSVPAPIRYGRNSELRNTVTMVFSKSCVSTNTLGQAKLVPFKRKIGSTTELGAMAGAIIKAEHKKDPQIKRFNWTWGCLAILINPRTDRKVSSQIRDYWSKQFGKKFDPQEFKVGKERSILNSNGELQFDWKAEYGDIDFVVVTATKPNISPIPASIELADYIRADKSYFSKNLEFGIKTFQDREILECFEKSKTVDGYKASLLGPIPHDWQENELGKVAQKIMVGIATEVKPHVCQSGVPIIRNQNIRDNYLDDSDLIYITKGFDNDNKNKRVKSGDVVIVRTGSNLGQACVVPDKFDNAQTFTTLIVRPGASLSSDFLSLHINSNGIKEVERLAAGGGKPNLNAGFLANYRLALPPLTEQIAIANLLSKWDKAIDTVSELIVQKERCKKWLMQQLLTGMNRLKGFKTRWEDIELGELLEYEQPTKYLVKDDSYNDAFKTPVLTAGKTFILGYTDEDEGICNELPVIIFDDFTTSSKFVDFPFKAKSSAMKLLRAKPKVDLKYVFEAMQMIKYAVGGHERHWISKFIYLTIPCPSYEEQIAIAHVLQTADNEIELLKLKRKTLRNQRKGLIQMLLTGKKRLKT